MDNGNGAAPSATVYVRNLDERIKIPSLVEQLEELFGEFGNVVEVIAKKSIKRKGQAFVVFDNAESAQDAIDALQDFDMHSRTLKLELARTRSDKTVEQEEGAEGLERHMKRRIAEKERKQALEVAEQQKQAKRPAPEAIAERPAKVNKAAAAVAGSAMADEYLPPNKVLILRELPEDSGKDSLTLIFNRFAGFREVRMVPGRKGIAFVEYEDEEGAITAKEATAGMEVGDKTMRVTYQRQ